jgi:large subunit ribosomal protein L2
MSIKVYNPTSPSRRKTSVNTHAGVDVKKKPLKSLIKGMKRQAGRNNRGIITVRHQGSGNKRLLRAVDFKQDKLNVLGRVVSLEYDPNRSAYLALLSYEDGERRYVLATEGVRKGDKLVVGDKVEVKNGNRMKLKNILPGTFVSNVELIYKGGGKIARSAGSWVQIMGHEEGKTQLLMPSSEVRVVSSEVMATIGKVSNWEHGNIRVGRAGRKRHMGIRPTVRGSAMNPCDHPHGGGEGKHPIGLKSPKTPWGKKARGVKTRKKKRYSNKFIVKRRKASKKRK